MSDLLVRVYTNELTDQQRAEIYDKTSERFNRHFDTTARAILELLSKEKFGLSRDEIKAKLVNDEKIKQIMKSEHLSESDVLNLVHYALTILFAHKFVTPAFGKPNITNAGRASLQQ